MKRLALIIFSLSSVAVTVQAGSLMNYIEMPLQVRQVLQFSAHGMIFKACEQCAVVVLKATDNVELLENGQSIDIKRASELYHQKQPDSLSVFYFRDSLTFDRVSFGNLPGPQ